MAPIALHFDLLLAEPREQVIDVGYPTSGHSFSPRQASGLLVFLTTVSIHSTTTRIEGNEDPDSLK